MSRFLGAAVIASAVGAGAVIAEVDFRKDVRPILSDKCFACHGFDEETREADLRLDLREGALMDLGGYVAIEPGNPEDSEVYIRLISEDKTERMPPPKAHKTMSKEEIEVIRQWIAEGAEYEEHWSYEKLERPAVPTGLGGNEVDGFVRALLKEQGLEASETADRETLIRRLSWDLRGLPPTGEEVVAFVADDAPGAWGRLVDRFLADPKYGERMAVWWLDLVRYADTIGYHSDNAMEVSAYRDYVIKAFNENKRYDQFTIEQLAGDLLPEATIEQKVASGYNRLLQTTQEGGAQAKEYRAIYAADRVRNVSEVWLGSTLGCAQCHDHKYDPFSAKDFYSMAAFFADINEVAVGARRPNLTLPTAEETERMAKLEAAIKEREGEGWVTSNVELAKRVAAGQKEWEKTALKADYRWRLPEAHGFQAPKGTTLTAQADGSILAGGKVPDHANYGFAMKLAGKVTALRVEVMTDESFAVKGGFSRGNGNFVLTGVEVKHGEALLKVAKVFADVEQDGYPAAATIDGKKETGWAVGAHAPEGRKGTRLIVFVLEKPVDLGDGGDLRVSFSHDSSHAKHQMGRFRVSVTDEAEPSLEGASALAPEVMAALQSEARTEAQEKTLREYYYRISPEVVKLRKEAEGLKKELEGVKKGQRTMLISEALKEPMVTRILPRGNWLDDSGEIVQPAVPDFLPDLEIGERRATRLDLAKWIVADDNPLAGRAVVNRLWRLYFGRGISANVQDLGGQGKPPSHPEMLDWLSVELRESGWDVKAVVRKMVMSETYQQRSEVDSILREKDGGNEFYARQGRWRVDAEFVRDAALLLGGLLEDEVMGGVSVKPYQPAGYWQHLNFPRRKWEQGSGADLYRRSLYTYWCRTFPHPSMVAFDAPSREECAAERARSNIPQQALALLNDPIFVEAARKFGERLQAAPGTVREKIAWGMREALARSPDDEEIDLLEQLYDKQLVRYAADEEAAKAFLSIGMSARHENVPVAELAAWAQVARALLNTYETTSRF